MICLLNKYATSDEIGLIFCIHGLYFISDRTFSPFTRSFVLRLNLRWWNWSLVDIASLVLECVFLQSVICKWNNLINLKSLFLILIYLSWSWTIRQTCVFLNLKVVIHFNLMKFVYSLCDIVTSRSLLTGFVLLDSNLSMADTTCLYQTPSCKILFLFNHYFKIFFYMRLIVSCYALKIKTEQIWIC